MDAIRLDVKVLGETLPFDKKPLLIAGAIIGGTAVVAGAVNALAKDNKKSTKSSR